MATLYLDSNNPSFMPSDWNTTEDFEIIGSKANDEIYTFGGDDLVKGGCGDDLLWTGSGNDIVEGGCGHDRIFSGLGNDNLYGGKGDDLITAGSGNNTLGGGLGDDRITINGTGGDNKLRGHEGNDVITVMTDEGFNELWGGSGADTLRVAPYGSRTKFKDFVYGEDTIEMMGVSSDDVTVKGGDVFYDGLKVIETRYDALTVNDLVFSSNGSIS